jgi:hypothetical protein
VAPVVETWLSLTLTVLVDPPQPADDLMRLGDRAAARVTSNSRARVAGTHATGPGLLEQVTWMLSLPAPRGEPLGSVLSRFEAAAREEAESGIALQTASLEGFTLDQLRARAEQQRDTRAQVVGVDEFRELLGEPGKPLSRQRLYELREQPDFPPAIARGVWHRGTAEHYALTRRRAGGRPPRGDVQPTLGASCAEC